MLEKQFSFTVPLEFPELSELEKAKDNKFPAGLVAHELIFGISNLSRPQLINVLKRSVQAHQKKIERRVNGRSS